MRITIIDRRNHHLFQPLLYQVATVGLSAVDIAQPIRKIFRRQQHVTDDGALPFGGRQYPPSPEAIRYRSS